MTESYREGARFPGRIWRTVAESVPAWPASTSAPAGAPNVLVVLLDDVGFAQLRCFGSDIHTPTFDAMAQGGLRYRDFHTTALCTPSRASLLTGRNHHANASAIVSEQARGFPGYNAMIPRENGFLSEILGMVGYATFALGKWHLTPPYEVAVGSTHARWPLGRGFDRFYGFLGGRTHQYVPDLVYDNHVIPPPTSVEAGYHLNADLADRAIEFISDLRAATPDRPFFLYYCPGAGHEPHHVPHEWADRYAGRFDAGWDRVRERIFARQLDLGLLPSGTELSARPDWVPAWTELDARERSLFARQMEVYAGFITHTDYHIGRVIEFLDRLGELDNTLVIVASDNGASSEGGRNGRNGFTSERATLESNLEMQERLGSPASFPNYSWGWTWVGNTPFKRWKRFVHEGGISDPLIVHWPAGVRARGEIRHQYVHVTDLAPTVLDILGIEPPREIAGVTQSQMHGVSFAHTLDDPDATTRKTIQYYEMYGSRAIWAGGWKAVTAHPQGAALTGSDLDEQRWEMYHVAEDPAECRDLAEHPPAKLRELIDLWWAEAGKYDVLPIDSRRDPAERRDRRARYTYYPGAAPVPASIAVDVADRSHRIRAEVHIPEGGASGVLLAHGGGPYGGYALYVKENRLRYVHSYPGFGEQCVEADTEIPDGAVALGVDFVRTDPQRGSVTLTVDGVSVGVGNVARSLANMASASGEGLCCGYDSGLAVSTDYAAPFRFTGTIRRVVVDVDA